MKRKNENVLSLKCICSRDPLSADSKKLITLRSHTLSQSHIDPAVIEHDVG